MMDDLIDFVSVWNGRDSLMGEYPSHPSALVDPQCGLDDTPLWLGDVVSRKQRWAARETASIAAGKPKPVRYCACGCGRVLSPSRTCRCVKGHHRRAELVMAGRTAV